MSSDNVDIKYKRFRWYVGTLFALLFNAWVAYEVFLVNPEPGTSAYNQRYRWCNWAWAKYRSPNYQQLSEEDKEYIYDALPPRILALPHAQVEKMPTPQWNLEDYSWRMNVGIGPNIFWVTGLLFLLMFWTDRKLLQSIGLRIDKDQMEFSPIWKNKLLGRTKRKWKDLHNVWLLGKHDKHIVRWERFILAAAAGPHIIFEFKSGGFADVTLPMLSKTQAEQFFDCLRRWCPPEVLSSDVTRLKEALIAGTGGTGFTQIWSDDLEMRHGSTHFEPLPADAELQNGRLRVVSELQTGGLSAVYLAEDKSGKRVVLKEAVLPLDIDEESRIQSRERFHREAKLLMRIEHPNVAKILDCFVENDRDYLVLDYVPGVSLRQFVAAKGKQDQKLVLEWAKQLADTLTCLHDMQPPVVHRDVTPDNMILREDGSIVLIDFGAANEFVGTATGTMIGKQCYIPPEQLRGKAEPKSDVYSLGAALFFLLSGKDPIALSCSDPCDVDQSIDPKLANVVKRCTDMESSSRLSSHELADMLRNDFGDDQGHLLKTKVGVLES